MQDVPLDLAVTFCHIECFYTVTTGRRTDDILDASVRMTPPVLQASFLRQNALCTMSAVLFGSVSLIMYHVNPTNSKTITAYKSDVITRLLRQLVIRHTTTSLCVGNYFFVLSCCVFSIISWTACLWGRNVFGMGCLVWDVLILIFLLRLSGRDLFSELLPLVCCGLM